MAVRMTTPTSTQRVQQYQQYLNCGFLRKFKTNEKQTPTKPEKARRAKAFLTIATPGFTRKKNQMQLDMRTM